MTEAYYPHVRDCGACHSSGLCPLGAALARDMVWLKCRRGHWKDSSWSRADISGSLHQTNAMPGKGVTPSEVPGSPGSPGTFQP